MVLFCAIPEPPLPPKRTTSELGRGDPGSKSEGEEDMGGGAVGGVGVVAGGGGTAQRGVITTINVHNPNSSLKLGTKAGTLGRTPNHLTLSTTSTLSVGSTGSQARLIQSSHAPSTYQPVMMKDLGKDRDSFDSNVATRNDGTASQTGDGTVVVAEETGGYAAMDRHLNAFNMAENANIVDYMQNLKVKHLEIQLSEEKQDRDGDKDLNSETVNMDESNVEKGRTGGEGENNKNSSETKSKAAVTKSQKERHNETQKSEKLILSIDASGIDTSTSPIKIIKIKSRSRSASPRRPSTGDGTKSPKNKENKVTTDEVAQQPGKTHGILKRSSSSKSMEGPELLSTPTGILKRSLSPNELAKLDGLSPRNSFDSRASPARSPVSDYGSQPNTVIDNRSPVLIVKHKGRSANKTINRKRSVSASASICNSLDSESNAPHQKRSLSTSNFDQQHQQMSSMDSEMSLLSPSYYYNQSCFSSVASLDNSFDNDMSSLHNSQERIMYEADPNGFNNHHNHNHRRRRSGNEAMLTKAIEQPTCMECFLQSRKVS